MVKTLESSMKAHVSAQAGRERECAIMEQVAMLTDITDIPVVNEEDEGADDVGGGVATSSSAADEGRASDMLAKATEIDAMLGATVDAATQAAASNAGASNGLPPRPQSARSQQASTPLRGSLAEDLSSATGASDVDARVAKLEADAVHPRNVRCDIM